ncbi:MAG: replication initiation protein [Treponema sp.]|jgi:plasmid replication initiation protein|nr:replication initiation protein [Treponema sp.]
MINELCRDQQAPTSERFSSPPAPTALVNTPQTLGVTPRYVLQHNAISRGAQNLSATAQKLAAMAMALLPSDLSSLTASFSFSEFCKALGMTAGGETYKIFKEAVNECMQCIISIETEPDKNGKKNWKKFTWFTVTEFSEETGQARMTFSAELAEFLIVLKWVYTKINLKDIGELQSRFAIHLFTIAMSYHSLAGKNGNRSQNWYFERGFPDEIRQLMGIKKDEYKDNHLLKQKVIEGPIKEINKAGIGIEITPKTVKQGNRIVSIRFYCKQMGRPVRRKGKSNEGEEATLMLPDPQAEQEREDKEMAHLRELYPNEFAERYQAAMDKCPPFLRSNNNSSSFAEYRAFKELREKYGIVK